MAILRNSILANANMTMNAYIKMAQIKKIQTNKL